MSKLTSRAEKEPAQVPEKTSLKEEWDYDREDSVDRDREFKGLPSRKGTVRTVEEKKPDRDAGGGGGRGGRSGKGSGPSGRGTA